MFKNQELIELVIISFILVTSLCDSGVNIVRRNKLLVNCSLKGGGGGGKELIFYSNGSGNVLQLPIVAAVQCLLVVQHYFACAPGCQVLFEMTVFLIKLLICLKRVFEQFVGSSEFQTAGIKF